MPKVARIVPHRPGRRVYSAFEKAAEIHTLWHDVAFAASISQATTPACVVLASALA